MENDNTQILIALIKAVLHQDKTIILEENIDWAKIYRLAQLHQIINIITEAIFLLPKAQRPPSDILEKFRKAAKKAVMIDATQTIEGNKIFQELEEHQIPYLPLKGWLMKGLYPRRDLRSMGDIDILIPKDQGVRVRDIMVNNGYEVYLYDKTNHDVYQKKPFMDIEMHTSLFFVTSDFYDYYSTIWDRLLPTNKPFAYEMKPEDLYIYLLIHMKKHFKSGGTGIRSIIDLYLYLETHPNLDLIYIEAELSKLKTLTFHKEIKALAYYWFANKQPSDTTLLISSFILHSGVYGNIETIMKRNLIQQGQESNLQVRKAKWILRRVFLKKDQLAITYPIVNKVPILLPVFWIYRLIIKYPLRKRQFKRELKLLNQMNLEKELEQEKIDQILVS